MIACVVVSYFAAILESYVRTAPDVPCILVEYRGQRGKVVAYSEDAHKLGVERGQSVSRARSLCPQADILPINPERYAQARNALLNILWEFTNRVEIDETVYPHTAICYLDLGNLNAEALALLGSLMLSALREHIGVSASVGIARAKFVAFIAARNETVTLVSKDEAAQFVAPHPIDLLPLQKEQARRLLILGIQTLGHLVALPRASVTAQFGKDGVFLHQLASGSDGRPVKPRQMPEQEAVRQQFEPLSERDRLDVRVYELAEDLSDKLAGRGSALHQLAVTIDFERGKPSHIRSCIFSSQSPAPVSLARVCFNCLTV